MTGLLLALLLLGSPRPVEEAKAPAPPRRVLAFYYTWYGTPAADGGWRHWDEHGHHPDRRDANGLEDVGAAHHPLEGLYSSLDPATVRRHARLSEEAGIDGWISTWWGRGDRHDRAFKLVLETLDEVHSPIEAGPYLETAGGDPARAERDLRYLLDTYGAHPRFLRRGGTPVVFVYSRAIGELGAARWKEIAGRLRRERPCVLVADSAVPELIAAFGGGHDYNPVTAVASGAVMSRVYGRLVAACRAADALATVTVIPGYDDRQVREPGLAAPRRGGLTYADLFREAVAAAPDWILISTFNEWHEGTEIEPSKEHGTHYLEETRARARHFEAGGGVVRIAAEGNDRGRLPELVVDGEGAKEVQAVLLPDLSRRAYVLRNLGKDLLSVGVNGFQGSAVGYSKPDDALAAPAATVLALSEDAPGSFRWGIPPRTAVHLFPRGELAAYLAQGGYGGDPDVREEVREGLAIRIDPQLLVPEGGKVILGAPGVSIPLRAQLVSLNAPRDRLEGAWSLDGEQRIALREGSLVIGPEVPAGGEWPLRLSWRGEGRTISRSFSLRTEEALRVEVVEARGGTLVVEAAARFGGLQEGPVEARLLEGERVLASGRGEGFGRIELRTSRDALRTARPLAVKASWNGVSVSRSVLLEARIDLGAGTEGAGLRHVGHSSPGDGRSEPVEAAGRRARRPLAAAGAGERYLYFDLDPSFVAGGPTEIELEWIDEGRGRLQLHYDSRELDPPLPSAYHRTASVELRGDGSLRTHTFRIEDAGFRGRENSGADFRIASSAPVAVTRVVVRKAD